MALPSQPDVELELERLWNTYVGEAREAIQQGRSSEEANNMIVGLLFVLTLRNIEHQLYGFENLLNRRL